MMKDDQRPSGPSAALPRESVLGQLRATPRIFGFMGWLLIGAILLGAREVSRWRYIEESASSEWSLGQSAAVSAVTVAVTGLLLGRVIDRRDPRKYVVLGAVIAAIGNVVTGLSLMRGPLPLSIILLSAVFDGAGIGIGAVALLKTQAAFVRPGAEGAVEIINILRLGAGGVVGAIIGGASPSPQATLLVSAVVMIPSTIGLWSSMRRVTPRLASPEQALRTTTFLTYLRTNPTLTGIVVLDLVLTLVIPTQLVNLVLLNLDVPELASLSIASGMAGVLLGRLALVTLGFRGSPRTIVLAAVVALITIQLLGAIALTDQWLLGQLLVLPIIVIVGSICSTYAQGLLAAIIQQTVDEPYRGSLASVLVAGRNGLISVGAIFGAFVSTIFGAQILVLTLAGALIAVTVLFRGFIVLTRVGN